MQDMPSCILAALEAKKVADRGCPPGARAAASSFLANTFAEVGLLEEAKKYLKEAEKTNELLKTSPNYYLNRINSLQEHARIATEEDRPADAISYLLEAEQLIPVDTAHREDMKIVSSTNNQLLGECYANTGEPKKADSLMSLLMADSTNLRDTKIIPYVYRVRADAALQLKDFPKALHYKNLMESHLASTELKDQAVIYEFYIKYYNATGNLKEGVRYTELLDNVTQERQNSAQEIWKSVMDRLEEDHMKDRNRIVWGWWISGGSTLMSAITLLLVWRKRQRNKIQYEQLIQRLEKNQASPTTTPIGQEMVKEEPDSHEAKGVLISDQTEKRLLSELEALEKDPTYILSKDISLSGIAIRLQTNDRYISYIIHKYRGTDFHHYIQQYRIQYIIDLAHSKPEMLDYKLAYWAELAGFSSHRKFSAVFKSVTGLKPSVFIYHMQQKLKN